MRCNNNKTLFLILLLVTSLFLCIAAEDITITPSGSEDKVELDSVGDPIAPVDPASITNPDSSPYPNDSTNNDPGAPDFNDPKSAIKDIGNIAKNASKEGLKSGINVSASGYVPLPKSITNIANFVFQADDTDTLERLIVLVGLFVMLFLIFFQVSNELVEKPIIGTFLALALTFIASFTGVIKNAADQYLRVFQLSTLQNTFIIVIIIIALFFILKMILGIFHTFKQSSKVEEAKRSGRLFRVFNRIRRRNAQRESSINRELNS